MLESLPTATLRHDLVGELIPFYDNVQIAFELLDTLQNALNDINGTLEECKEMIDMSIEALPYMTMPHSSHVGWGEVEESLIEERLLHMRKEILLYSGSMSQSDHFPFIITIARSAEDGFTPRHVVDYLQDRVLNEIHSIYCGCISRIESRHSSISRKADKYLSPAGEGCCCNFFLDYLLQHSFEKD